MILNQRHALYSMEQWAEERMTLASIFPGREAKAYNDDRLGRSLDALFAADLRSVHGAVSAAMVRGFQMEVQAVHHDTTSFSFYGAYEAKDGESEGKNARTEPPRITYGYSRDRRPDLKQVVAGLSVEQEGIPLLGTIHDGNHGDGPNYLEHWLAVSEMLSRSDFLYLGDTKLYSEQRIAEILQRGGQVLCPMPMTGREQRWIAHAIQRGEITFEEVELRKGQRYGLWETEFEIRGEDHQRFRLRKIVVRSVELAEKEQRSRQERGAKAMAQLEQLSRKVGRYKLKEKCAIEREAPAVLEHYRVGAYLRVSVEVRRERLRVQVGRGRPGPKTVYQERETEHYGLKVEAQSAALERAALCEGVFLLCCSVSKEKMSAEQVLREHKGQYKVERGHRDLKGPIAVTPIFLHKPERVAARSLVCILALQLLRLMEWQARKHLQEKGEKLQGLSPNRLGSERPSGVKMLEALSKVYILQVTTKQGSRPVLSLLSPLQAKVLDLLRVPIQAYTSCHLLEKFQNSS